MTIKHLLRICQSPYHLVYPKMSPTLKPLTSLLSADQYALLRLHSFALVLLTPSSHLNPSSRMPLSVSSMLSGSPTKTQLNIKTTKSPSTSPLVIITSCTVIFTIHMSDSSDVVSQTSPSYLSIAPLSLQLTYVCSQALVPALS